MTTDILKVESIQTGLTANYVPYWTITQGLKEAMQNIAYGAIKSGKKAKLYYDQKSDLWAIKDKYTGFEKRHLYIGESDQRDDEDGLGTFGEGWKIFLLVMARNGIFHKVSTVGFTFWGQMEPTPHGPEVLTILVTPNEQTSGTTVYADVQEYMWRNASQSFAVLQGIDADVLKTNTKLEGRKQELWVQGVRIEQEDNLNPLNLHYSYNLAQRSLINRDRSHVNTELAYKAIQKIIFEMSEDEIKEYVSLAIQGNQREDVLKGPVVPVDTHTNKRIWREILAEAHNCEVEELLAPSYNQIVNERAKEKGYTLLDTPRKWDFELGYLGISRADDVLDDRYDVVESHYVGGSAEEDKTAFAKVKRALQKITGLSDMDALPKFQYVSEIKNAKDGHVKTAHYDKSLEIIYIDTTIMDSQQDLFRALMPEVMTWQFGETSIWEREDRFTEYLMRALNL